MGMAASQARYLSLQARMSNVEYQGQQINQERTILSQQATALYNSLLDMQVPTPPSTSDYSTIKYTGVDGATSFSIGNIKPSGNDYVVELNTSATGSMLSKDAGVLKVHTDRPTKFLKPVTVGTTPAAAAAGQDDFYTVDTQGERQYYTISTFRKYYILVTENVDDAEGNSVENARYITLAEAIEKNGAGKYGLTAYNDTGKYYISDPEKFAHETDGVMKQVSNGDEGKEYGQAHWSGYAIGGYETYELKSPEGKELIERYGGNYDEYVRAISNTYGTGDNSLTAADFYVYVDTSGTYGEIKFAKKSDAGNVTTLDAWTETYSYLANGKFTRTEEKDQCKLKFDASGRITQIGIPKYEIDDEGHEITDKDPIGYTYIDLKAEETYDKVAYEDAYNQYEYDQYLYDKKVQEINAKTEIIQAEDRSLELRLQRLDNERTQLKTEMEAVEKVINENIENSYKTFSG